VNNDLVHRAKPGLERILQCKLYLARGPRAFHLSEIRAVGDIAVRIEELGGVEDVEEFGAELDGLVLFDLRDLLYGKIEVFDACAAADRPLGGSQGPKGGTGERVRIERIEIRDAINTGESWSSAVCAEVIEARVAGMEVGNLIRLAWELEVEAVHQLLVIG